MSDNKGFDSMRDLVRALQQTEYGLRTGNLSTDDVGKACDNARELYERLVVIRHKSREDRVHEDARTAAPTKAEVLAAEPMKAPAVPAPAVAKAEVVAKEPEHVKEPTPATSVPVAAKPASVPALAKAEIAPPVKQPTPAAPVVAKSANLPVVAKAEEAPKAQEQPVKEQVATAPAPVAVEKASAPVAKSEVEVAPKAVEPIAEVAPKPTPTPIEEPVAVVTQATASVPKATETEAAAGKEKVKNDAPKSASDYLKDANATPAPAPEMAAIRAQQVVARSGSAPAPVLVTTVAEKMEKAQITDLAKAVTVSHKFWFTTELFGGDRGAYETGMARLNSAKDMTAAKAMLETDILPKLKKPAHEEALNAFAELLQRRFE